MVSAGRSVSVTISSTVACSSTRRNGDPVAHRDDQVVDEHHDPRRVFGHRAPEIVGWIAPVDPVNIDECRGRDERGAFLGGEERAVERVLLGRVVPRDVDAQVLAQRARPR